ncbi:MAG: hypothetical protein ABFS37_07260 [Acidobacteriota bacterium]
MVLAPNVMQAEDSRASLEITGSSISPSINEDGAWGWWDPRKYQLWEADQDDSFDLAELRLTMPGDEFSGFLAVELYPELTGTGVQYDDEGALVAEHQLEAEITVYDLAMTRTLNTQGAWLFRPWIALTHMQIEEKRNALQEEGLPVDRARSKLWGAAVGLAAETSLPWNLRLSGRVVARWATGDRDATFTPESSYGVPGSTQVKSSDSVDRFMWGGELGIRWQASAYFGLESGWRYRDWTDDDGPASFDGLYLRLLLRL